MPRSIYKPAALLSLLSLASLLLLLGLSSCGSGAGSSDGLTHIQGSSATITKPMLDHWMRSLVGQDFRSEVGTKGPAGLVSEPANYSECVEAAKKIVPRTYTGKLKISDAQISAKCHELYEAVKAQALAFLLSAQWTAREGEEAGIQISDAELRQNFKRYQKEVFGGSGAAQQTYLAERHLSLADVLYTLKHSLLVSRLLPKFQARVAQAGGGERTFARLALAHYNGLIAKTSCEPGYVVLGCKEYREPAVPPPSPAVILEELAGAVG